MQGLSVLDEIFCPIHDFAHRFEYHQKLLAHLNPGAAQAMYGRGTECRDDGRERREVVQLAAFLENVSDPRWVPIIN